MMHQSHILLINTNSTILIHLLMIFNINYSQHIVRDIKFNVLSNYIFKQYDDHSSVYCMLYRVFVRLIYHVNCTLYTIQLYSYIM